MLWQQQLECILGHVAEISENMEAICSNQG